MIPDPLDRVRSVRDIPALIAYLRDELDWPIRAEDFDELTFEYEPEKPGIDQEIANQLTLGAIRKGGQDNVIRPHLSYE